MTAQARAELAATTKCPHTAIAIIRLGLRVHGEQLPGGRAMQQPTLVVVEDDLLFAQALTALVEDLGYRVLATADTEQGAVEVVNECRPDVDLMDIRLMGGSGLGAASTIRQSSKRPIIFCTSYAHDRPVHSALHP